MKLKFEYKITALAFSIMDDVTEVEVKRYSADNWEMAYGNSWEMITDPEKYEAEYQRLKKAGLIT